MTHEHPAHAPVAEGDVNTTGARRAWAEARPDSAILTRDAEAFYHQVLSSPCLDEVVGAHGPWLTLRDGRRLLDFHGNSVHQLGFGHQGVIRAVTEQLARLPFSTRRFANEPATRLAERLIASAPGDLRHNARVLLAPSGAVAVGIALKIARAVTGRHKTIAFRGSFHGATLDAAAAGGQELFRRGQGPLGGLHAQPPGDPGCRHRCGAACSAACAADIETLLEREPGIAAVVAEPVRATTVRVPPGEYWPRVRAACDRAGALLIFDEIPTGLGRTGKLWATEHTGVTPDLMVIGKGLGGAVFPQAAVIGRPGFNDTGVVPVRELAIGHYTHEKSPVGAAAALATLDAIEREGLVERSARLGEEWASELHEALASTGVLKEVRSLGLMVGVELAGQGAHALADRVLYESLDRGLSFKVGGGTTLVLFPPLNIEEDLLRRATGILRDAIAAATASLK